MPVPEAILNQIRLENSKSSSKNRANAENSEEEKKDVESWHNLNQDADVEVVARDESAMRSD